MENFYFETNSVQLTDVEKETVKIDKLTGEITSGLDQLSFQDKHDKDEDRVPGEDTVAEEMGGIFKFLPEEMWLEVLDKVIDSQDILHALKAFPELDKAFQFHKASWLFGLVLPHLMTKQLVVEERGVAGVGEVHLYSQELLQLRLVSKRWKYSVDKSLENHTDRHPLSPRGRGNAENLHSSMATIPDNHFNYYRMWDSRLGATIFHGSDDIDTFLHEMRDHRGNPFPGNSVLLQIQFGDFWKALRSTLTLLENFGEHVLDLEIGCPFYEYFIGDMELCHNILLCLTLIPNLRSLITGKLFRTTDPQTTNYYGTPESQQLFPELKNLKRFEWRGNSNCHSTWITRLFETYGRKDGLRKLGIPLNLILTVNLAATAEDSHLSELHIFLDDNFDGNVGRIGIHLRTLPNFQEIRKFYLSFVGSEGLPRIRRREVEIKELIGVLAEFQFESVVLQDFQLIEEGHPNPAHVPATTITSIVVEDKWGLNFDFLRLLPNLKFLSVYVGGGKALQYLREYYRRVIILKEGEVVSVGARLRKYFVKVYIPSLRISGNESIWRDLPKLEMLSIAMQNDMGVDTVGVQFVKEFGNKGFFGARPLVIHTQGNVEAWVKEIMEEEESDGMGMMWEDWVEWWEMVEGDAGNEEGDRLTEQDN